MTDPTGRSFLSYRRTCADDAQLLVEAQHDVGIPTWQDVANLAEEPTEDAIRKVLADPQTANAILWLTPDVAESPMIRKVEIPEVLRRFSSPGDGRGGREVGSAFFVTPVLARGLDYADADSVLEPRFASGLEDWNLRRMASPHPITAREAAQVAAWVLERRIERIHRSLPPEAPLRLSLFTREPAPFRPGEIALSLDWSHRFDGREARPGAWDEHLLPALRTVALQIAAKAHGRRVEAEGRPALAACMALGCAFLATRYQPITWRQVFRGSEQLWSLDAPPEESGFVAHTCSLDVNAQDLAVLVSVTEDAEPAFASSGPDLPKLRALIHVRKPGGLPHRLASAGEAVDVADKVIAAIKAARRTYREVRCTHLFLSVPAGVALMIGQLANTLGPLQTYEHVPVDAVGRYRPAVRLTA